MTPLVNDRTSVVARTLWNNAHPNQYVLFTWEDARTPSGTLKNPSVTVKNSTAVYLPDRMSGVLISEVNLLNGGKRTANFQPIEARAIWEHFVLNGWEVRSFGL